MERREKKKMYNLILNKVDIHSTLFTIQWVRRGDASARRKRKALREDIINFTAKEAAEERGRKREEKSERKRKERDGKVREKKVKEKECK